MKERNKDFRQRILVSAVEQSAMGNARRRGFRWSTGITENKAEFIHSSVNGHLGCLHVMATVSNAAMNMGLQLSFQDYDFVSFR